MRRIILLSLFAVLASDASAQRRGGAGQGGFSRGGPRRVPFRGNSARGFGFNRGLSGYPYGFGYGGFGYGGFDYGNDGFYPDDAGTPYGYPPPPSPLIVRQVPPAAIAQQPPREVHPVIIDYAPLAPVASAPAEGEPQTFGIVLKDGSTRAAKAVVVVASDEVLQYVDPEERHMRISMNEVDREATRKLNRERNLNLWLPAAPPSAVPGR
jgi:hypothetical protein